LAHAARALALLVLLAAAAAAGPDLASLEVLGQGTPGAAGTPRLAATGLPAVGQPAFDVRLEGGRPDTAALVIAGARAAPTPLPGFGATLWPSTPFVALPATIGADGASLPLLETPGTTPAALLGQGAVAQGLVVDPSARGGIAFTNGLALAFGIGSAAAAHFALPNVLAPAGARELAVGDLDGDGLPEIVTASENGALAVALATPGGVHLPRPPVPTGESPLDLALADLDGDGALDAVVSHLEVFAVAAGRVSVHPGNGDGTLGPPNETVVGNEAGGLAVADATGDGVPDVVVTRKNAVLTLPGQGDGTLGPLVPTLVGFGGTTPLVVEAAELDGDGLLDLLVADETTTLHVLGGLGDGSFVQRQTLFAYDVAVGDVDGDGVPDLVALTTTGLVVQLETIVWHRGLGDGTFGGATTIDVPAEPLTDVAVGDVDGDGVLDVVVGAVDPIPIFVDLAQVHAAGLAVLRGLGGGTFDAPAPVRVGEANELVLADLDGDADLDAAGLVDDGDVVVLARNPGQGVFTTPAAHDADPELSGARALDVDLDAVPDLVETVADEAGLLGWRRGLGDGTFAPAASLATGVPLGLLVTSGELDGDGQEDLLLVDQRGLEGSLHVLVGQGPASYADAGAPIPTTFPTSAELADVDGDGVVDLALVVADDVFTSAVEIHLGRGDGTFAPASTIAPGATLIGLALGELTGDGVADLVTTPILGAPGGPAIEVRPGLGDGTFGAPIATPIDLILAQHPRLADLDGDGLLDVVVTSGEVGRLLAGRGAGDGTFTDLVEHPTGRRPRRAEPVDLNGDGALDLAVPLLEGSGVSVLLGLGDGGLAPAQPFSAGSATLAVQPVDVDGDGAPDLLANVTWDEDAPATFALLRNTGGPGAP